MTNDLIRQTPRAAAIAVVLRGPHFLLVRRGHRPDAGKWGFPGGKIELGETIVEAALRELDEETGVRAAPIDILTALDVIRRDRDGTLHHYVLIAVLCRWEAGDGVAADDADEARWFDAAEIGSVQTSPDVEKVALMALARGAA
ncbi:MAG: NUDIX hydrolase [Rhodospirillaceae bacterium]|nr:NUDIX hydrolase [Rhodospirillaceae bacterium]